MVEAQTFTARYRMDLNIDIFLTSKEIITCLRSRKNRLAWCWN